jgi:hypothetical protein
MWLELMATKDEALKHFKRYKVAAELELNLNEGFQIRSWWRVQLKHICGFLPSKWH